MSAIVSFGLRGDNKVTVDKKQEMEKLAAIPNIWPTKEIAGNLIIIDHHNGYMTRYGRLKDFAVEKGDRVKRGQVIGYVGNTGRSTAPHLHYEVRLENKPLNPLEFIKN